MDNLGLDLNLYRTMALVKLYRNAKEDSKYR